MTQQNDVNELRDILFDTLKQLKDKENPIEIDRAKAISDIAQTIINTAKVEIDHAKITGSPNATAFIPQQQEAKPQLPGITGGYIHKSGQRHNN